MEIDVDLNYDLLFAGDELHCEITFRTQKTISVLWASMLVYGQTSIKNGVFLKTTDSAAVGSFLPTLNPENGQFFFSTPQTIILCDALIEPHETKRAYYTCKLPFNLPTSFYGSIIKYSYFASIICQLDVNHTASIQRFPIFVINPISCLELCQVQKFLPKNLDETIAESKEILSNAPTTKSQLQNHLGLKGDGRIWVIKHIEDISESSNETLYVNNTLNAVGELLKENSSKSINVKRQGELVTLSMETTRFRPGDSVRGRFDFSNSQIDCLQTSVLLRYTEIINKEEISLFPGENYEHIHVIDWVQESTKNVMTTFFNFVLTVDAFPQFKTTYANLEWSLLFQFVIQADKSSKPENFQFVLPISVIVQEYLGELDGKKGDESAHFNLLID